MSHTDAWALPDPYAQPEFYADVSVKRLVAWLIDGVLILILSLLVVPFTAFTAIFFFPLLWLLVGLAYRIVALARHSATPGMRLMAIEFRTFRGERFDIGHAVAHTVLYTVSVGVVVLQVISIVLMLTTPRGQGLGDHLLGSAAINRAAGL